MAYNGWKNYETWNLALWVSSEKGVYLEQQARRPFTVRSAQEFAHEIYPNGTPDMDGPADYHKVCWREIVRAWNE